MPRLRIPDDIYNKARIIARREGMDFRAWARAKALKYNGGPVSCETTRNTSVVVQVDVALPVDTVRSAIVSAVRTADSPRESWSKAAIDGVIFAERFFWRECGREKAIQILDAKLEKRVSELAHEKVKTHRKAVAK